jgi:2-isopropylmalate synthase
MGIPEVLIFDTTLRDGEQAPGNSLLPEEKLRVARQLDALGVDIIEAGFPAASESDYRSIREIATEVRSPVIAALARCTERDIELAGEALSEAARGRIHVFVSTSDLHIREKLRTTPAAVLEMTRGAVRLARQYTDDVEFSAEDASRTDADFLCQVVEVAIEEGAGTINLPDTVGYATPAEYGAMFRDIRERVPGSDGIVLSAHCHDDLGLATANTLAAIAAGAAQVECTINGIGERAGNAALEELVMALHTRRPFFRLYTNIETRELARTSRLVSKCTGIGVPPNKAIVGANAFAHEAGIHQDGVLKNRLTYEIMSAETVGWDGIGLVLGKHSGRHALRVKTEALGYELTDDELSLVFARFKELADRKKLVDERDIHSLMIREGSGAVRELS